MIDIIKDSTERAQAEKEKWMVFGELVSYLCRQHEHLEYEIEMFMISPEGVVLETPSEIIRYHIDAEHRSETVKILCTIKPYGYPVGECQYGEVSGKTVLLRHLVEEAIAWPDLADYGMVMGNLTTYIASMTGTKWEKVAEQLQQVAEVQRPTLANGHTHAHTDDCVCQQKPETIIQAVLDYLSGKNHELKWDIALSLTSKGQHLNSLAVLNFLMGTEVEEGARMGIGCTGINYGRTSDELEGAIRLTDLITHACTWTGGHEQQDVILYGMACLLNHIKGNDEDNIEHYRQALDACYNALHNTRLH